MTGHPVCPRCGSSLRTPSAWEPRWRCALHGDVAPLRPFAAPSVEGVRRLAGQVSLPLWLPWPLPHGWVLSGVGYAGADPDHARACVLACSGPNPLGGAGEMVVVAEEPGVGLGGHYAGIEDTDPGEDFGRGVAQARIVVQGHPWSLWCVEAAPDRAAYAGEAAGRWIWIVLDPPNAAALLLEDLRLVDARDLGDELELIPCGALSPLLARL